MQCAEVRFNPAGKGTTRAEIFRKIVLQVWNVRSILNVTLTVSHPKKVQGVAIIFKHFYEKFFFSRAFQAPLKSNTKLQGFSGTSRSSTNHAFFILSLLHFLYFGGCFNKLKNCNCNMDIENEMVTHANLVLHALFLIYHLKSNAHSWDNCLIDKAP